MPGIFWDHDRFHRLEFSSMAFSIPGHVIKGPDTVRIADSFFRHQLIIWYCKNTCTACHMPCPCSHPAAKRIKHMDYVTGLPLAVIPLDHPSPWSFSGSAGHSSVIPSDRWLFPSSHLHFAILTSSSGNGACRAPGLVRIRYFSICIHCLAVSSVWSAGPRIKA